MIIRLFVLFTALNLLFSIRGFAQQEKNRVYDVDSLLLYETEGREDSLVYVKRDGSRLGAKFMIPPAKCSSDSILIMDNMRSHHAKAVKALLDQMKVHYIFLPPYSPDLNPIEKLWSKVKSLLRKFKARSEDRLSDAIRDAFRAVTVSDCLGWFRSCGYVL